MHPDVNAKYQALEVVHFRTHEHNNHTLEVSSTRLWASSAIVSVCSTLTPTILMHTRVMKIGVEEDMSNPLHKHSKLPSLED
jgi:hypothetical protein